MIVTSENIKKMIKNRLELNNQMMKDNQHDKYLDSNRDLLDILSMIEYLEELD